ncbi:MAG: hypothetical protein KDB53_13910 [Planctomycetes bacterium]|nr:hypothetical protein [Planctomycetota bacterium]
MLLTCGAIVVLGLWIGIVWVALAGCLAFATYRVWYVRQQARGLQHLRTALRKLKVIPLKYATETGEPETPGPDGVDR